MRLVQHHLVHRPVSWLVAWSTLAIDLLGSQLLLTTDFRYRLIQVLPKRLNTGHVLPLVEHLCMHLLFKRSLVVNVGDELLLVQVFDDSVRLAPLLSLVSRPYV